MQFLFSNSHDPAYNLALEEILFKEETAEYCLMYVNSPCVVIGSNQVFQREVNEEYCKANNIPVFRRITGGGAVYHDMGNLIYSFITNRREDTLSGSFLDPVIEILKSYGLNAFAGKRKDLWMPGEFKISGTASHLNSLRVIQHGTLLYDADLSKLQAALQSEKLHLIETKGIASVPSPVKNIRQFLSDQNTQNQESNVFFREFSKALAGFLNCENAEDLQKQLHPKIILLRDSKYSSDQWNKKK